MLLCLFVPLLSISGISAADSREAVTESEKEEITNALGGFYQALSLGASYEKVRDRYLTVDYFSEERATLENLSEAARRTPFDNTIDLLTRSGIGIVREVRCRIVSISANENEVVVTQRIDVVADHFDGEVDTFSDGGPEIIVRRRSHNPEQAASESYLVRGLVQNTRLREEDGLWKIAEFGDELSLLRMDVDNPYGPVLLFLINEVDRDITPHGPGVFKVIPIQLVPDAHNANFVLEAK
jgi:hypothetical protein